MNCYLLPYILPFEYLIIREILYRYISCDCLTTGEKIFLYPLEYIDKSDLSLTERIDVDSQIRFFLKKRVLKKVAEMAKKISNEDVKSIDVNIDYFSYPLVNGFLNALSRMGVEVKLLPNSSIHDKNNSLTDNEKKLIFELVKGSEGNINLIQESINKMMNSGDIYTADHLIEHCLKYFSSYEETYANLIGTIKNCIDSPIEAEYYYLKSKSSGQCLDIIKANYALSMLFLRHHKRNKISIDEGGNLLQRAYEIINSGGLDDLSIDDKNFFTVFNRNGYGLFLTKTGETNNALKLLQWGINRLSKEHQLHEMHRSVILYNICLCYRILGDFDNAIRCFDELINIDYAFPEYHLEKGACFREIGDHEEYIRCINKALSINPMHSDSHYLLSLELSLSGNTISAEKHARLAWEISGDDTTAYNYAYILSLNNNYSILDEMFYGMSIDLLPDYFILKAEVLAVNSNKDAYNYLLGLQSIFPNNNLINENIKCLADA